MNERSQTISIKRLVAHGRQLFIFLLRRWIWIVAAGILGSTAGIVYAYTKKPVYSGELSFVLSDANSQGGFLNIANQFGIDLNGGGGNDVFSQNNVMYLMTSRKMISRALFRQLPGSKESLVNFFLRTKKINEGWKKEPRLASAYPMPANPEQVTPVQDSLLRELYSAINAGNLAVSQPDKNVSLFKVTTTSDNELFSCYLTKYLVEESSSFYIETKTSIARQNLAMLRHEADSLQGRVFNSISSGAAATERIFNLNPSLQVQRVPIQKSQIDASVTQAAYAEVLKNLEVAKIALEKAYPIYQLLDEPSLPLKQEKPSRSLSAILFGAVATFLVMLFFTGIFLIKAQLAKENNNGTKV